MVDQKRELSQQSLSEVLERVALILDDSDVYFGHGTDNAWDEAVQLVCYVLNIPLETDHSVLSRQLSFIELESVATLLNKRLTERIPLPYLTHRAWFMGMPFYVDERVLIPRSPFAEIIQNEFSPWINAYEVNSILEIGTGSGCMSIAAATVFTEIDVVACDIHPGALDVAHQNVNQYDLGERIQLLQSDVFSTVSGQFDIIMSNPPYVSDEEMATLPAEYLVEPDSALRAAEDGLYVVDKVLRSSCDFLTDHGVLIVEVGNSQEALEKRYPDCPFTWIEFSNGGSGVFVLTKKQLQDSRDNDG